jgi:acyl-coenzyme A synthetase/AMP-(fatty) acid ligase
MSSFVDSVLDHAATRPSAPALRWRGTEVSYAELADLTRRAHDGLPGEDALGRVAVVAKKSPETIALILACMLAGRAVLVPPPDLGGEALGRLVQRAGCGRVLTGNGTARPVPGVSGDSAQLVLTTSGSTGTPKIVPLSATATAAFADWATAAFDLGPGVAVLNYAPLNFDLTLLEVWTTLRAGGCAVLVESDHAVKPQYLRELFAAGDIHVVQAVPIFYRIFAEAAVGTRYPAVRDVVLTGDHTPLQTRARLPELFPHARFHNVYGCTETNDSFIYTFDGETAAGRPVLPLGEPLPGVRTRIVGDDGGELVGAGNGELWVATPFQLHGQDPRLVTDDVGTAYFRTGDIVARDAYGELTLVGRNDLQVKVRGVRVAIEDVERVISEHGDVAEVGVVALPDPQAGHRLHAMVRRRSAKLTGLALREHCAKRLVRAAIPAVISVVDTPLPATSTGKVDRNTIKEKLQTEMA